jgi:hypothetical protein
MNRSMRAGAIFAGVIFYTKRSENQIARVLFRVDKTVRKFRSFAEAEKADRQFYQKLTGNERLQILVDLLNHGPEQRLERVSRITKLPWN